MGAFLYYMVVIAGAVTVTRGVFRVVDIIEKNF